VTDTFTPPIQASYSPTGRDWSPRVKSAQVGDTAYRETAPDGINPDIETITARWENLATTEADAIESFLEAHCAASFFWQSPFDTDATRRWITTSLHRTVATGNTDYIDATMSRAYDLD
jgi:phage-related protein